MSLVKYQRRQIALQQSNLPSIAQHMFSLMLRNVASDGFVFTDPHHLGVDFSTRGCIIASPSYAISGSSNDTIVNQDYVYNWTRDSAVAAMELAAANMPTGPGQGVQPLIDYVNFANICQQNALSGKGENGTGGPLNGTYPIGWASYTIEGQPRNGWSEQTDGPALQTLAILQAFPQLDAPTQATAKTVIGLNIKYLLDTYQSPPPNSLNLWEELRGLSFFARAVQLRCFQAITSNTFGISVPSATAGAITFLQNALQAHWNGTYYISIQPPPPPSDTQHYPYDPNIDIVLASVYGAIPYTDTKLLATAALLRNQWANSSSSTYYPINGADQSLGNGPMLGRYPGDIYDGDNDQSGTGHPWALCTAAFAELYYGLANAITKSQAVPIDAFSGMFFSQIGVTTNTPVAAVVSSLQSAGDAMLNALIYHSDHLELSEQFDRTSGYEKSVSDLTWSYAAFLSAVRAKTGQSVLG